MTSKVINRKFATMDNKKIKMQYENLPQEAKDHTERLYQEKTEFDKIKAIPHKMMLDLLRRLV